MDVFRDHDSGCGRGAWRRRYRGMTRDFCLVHSLGSPWRRGSPKEAIVQPVSERSTCPSTAQRSPKAAPDACSLRSAPSGDAIPDRQQCAPVDRSWRKSPRSTHGLRRPIRTASACCGVRAEQATCAKPQPLTIATSIPRMEASHPHETSL